MRTDDSTSDVEGRPRLPTLLANGRLENVLEVESTPTSYNADEMCQDRSTDRRRITDDEPTFGVVTDEPRPSTSMATAVSTTHRRRGPPKFTPTPESPTMSHTVVRPTAAPFALADGLVPSSLSDVDSADDFCDNISKEEAVADATVVGHGARSVAASRRRVAHLRSTSVAS